MMIELDEKFSDVTVRLMVVKSAKRDVATHSTRWQGATGNKVLDSFNNERFTVMHQQYIKLKAPNYQVRVTCATSQLTGSGTFIGNNFIGSRATKIVRFSVPGKKFTRSGILQYENQTTQTKFFDYHFLVYAYSNFAGVDLALTAYNLAYMSDCLIKLHYKDA